MEFQPAYIKAYTSGDLDQKIEQAFNALHNCTLCPRQCKVDRFSRQRGICKTGIQAKVASYQPHFGEEEVLVGNGGSGTIFFSNCNLMCNFCQNFDISHSGQGEEVTDTQLANMMIWLENYGCHNINLVTPSHVVPQILSALKIAIENGLSIPLVYNTSSYDSFFTLKLLDGIIDIYMPDFKFVDPVQSELTMNATDYPEIAKRAILEMYRQVGDLVIDSKGIAQRGLIVRHLLMPGNTKETGEIFEFLSNSVSKNTFTNIMNQYKPQGTASQSPEINKLVTDTEFKHAIELARLSGLHRLVY